MKKLFFALSLIALSSSVIAMDMAEIGEFKEYQEQWNGLKKPNLVNVQEVGPDIGVRLYYAHDNNNHGDAIFPSCAKAYLDKTVAQDLSEAQKEFKKAGYVLYVGSAYRPWRYQKMFYEMWKAQTEREDWKNLVADPKKGGVHTRGGAVAVSLFSKETGKQVVMPPIAVEKLNGKNEVTRQQSENAKFLARIMKKHNFDLTDPKKWYHFDHTTCSQLQPLDVSFEELAEDKD